MRKKNFIFQAGKAMDNPTSSRPKKEYNRLFFRVEKKFFFFLRTYKMKEKNLSIIELSWKLIDSLSLC